MKLTAEDGYTTHSFNSLSKPLPVKDIFVSASPLIALRLTCRGLIFSYAWGFSITRYINWYWWFLTIIFLAFEVLGIHGIGRLGIPTVRQFWSVHSWPQQFWFSN